MKIKKMTLSVEHKHLVEEARKWLVKKGFGLVLTDGMGYARTSTGERPDAIGFKSDISVLIECKTSRADFLADKNKPFRKAPAIGVGDWRFYLSSDDSVSVDDLPEGWGLLSFVNGRVVEVFGIPANTKWVKEKPFQANLAVERQLLYSAARKAIKA